MQKMVYLSNSRDYTEQGDVNENKYFARLNKLLEQGWKVSHVTPNTVALDKANDPSRQESFGALVLLEKCYLTSKTQKIKYPEKNRKNIKKAPNLAQPRQNRLHDSGII